MLLTVDSLTIAHVANGHETRLVDNLSFSVDQGETLAIVGESGSGKSVSSLAILGLLSSELNVTAGSVMFDGVDLLTLSAEEMRQRRGRDISMVFQEPMTSLNPVRSIGSQIIEGIEENLGLSRIAARERAIKLLKDVGVADAQQRLRQYPHHFSGGMRQRVMIAIALSANPKLIIADEPTTALDVTIQAQVLDLMVRLCREHAVALILITHNLGLVARYAKRVNVMYAGRLVESGEAKTLYASPKHPYTEGLLRSVPRLTQSREVKLQPIDGTPADPFAKIAGCRFHPRCRYAQQQCATSVPEFSDGVACYFPINMQAQAL